MAISRDAMNNMKDLFGMTFANLVEGFRMPNYGACHEPPLFRNLEIV